MVTAYLLYNGSATSCAVQAKADRCRRSESESEQGVQFVGLDPKPGDLAMSRLKVR